MYAFNFLMIFGFKLKLFCVLIIIYFSLIFKFEKKQRRKIVEKFRRKAAGNVSPLLWALHTMLAHAQPAGTFVSAHVQSTWWMSHVVSACITSYTDGSRFCTPVCRRERAGSPSACRYRLGGVRHPSTGVPSVFMPPHITIVLSAVH